MKQQSVNRNFYSRSVGLSFAVDLTCLKIIASWRERCTTVARLSGPKSYLSKGIVKSHMWNLFKGVAQQGRQKSIFSLYSERFHVGLSFV